VCWLSVVSSAAIDHSIHARDASSASVDTSSPASTQDGSAEGRSVPYVMQSGQGIPPPLPPAPLSVPQPGGVYPQVPYAAGTMLLLLVFCKI